MKFNNNQTLAESVVMRGLELSESRRWKDYSVAIREGYKEKNKTSIPDNILATTATLLENTYQYAARMDETTRTVNLGSFIDYGFDVISATVPNLIAHDIVSVQPMNAKHGAVFYLQYLYGTDKGGITAGTAMNNPFSGQDGQFNYSNNVINGEVVAEGITSSSITGVKLNHEPVLSGTIKVYKNGTLVAQSASTADGKDTIAAVGGSGVTGELTNTHLYNYVTKTLTGVNGGGDENISKLSLQFGSALSNTDVITVDYQYDMDHTTTGYSQVDLDLASISLEAQPRKLRARWLLDAGFELQKMKGIDAESELVTAMSNEIKFEIDGELLNSLKEKASVRMNEAGEAYKWDCKMPAYYMSYTEYKRTLIDVFTEISNRIFTLTKRVGANFIVAGVNVCNIIETLPEFNADSLGVKTINGPHKIGKLNNKWDVYKNPFYNDNEFVLGYKGSSWLDAGFVYAPYMPLYATPTQVLDDFIFRKGLATSYGQVMLNSNLYATGYIENYSATRMVPAAPATT